MPPHFDPELINPSDVDNSAIYTSKTPPETIAGDVTEDQEQPDEIPSPLCAPWPGSTYMIRSTSPGTAGQVITLLEGRIVLAKPGSRGSSQWDCIEKNGWLGFRNPVSGKLLGHDEPGWLRCVVDQHRDWEYFCVRMKPDGGFVLLLRNGEKAESLCQVGVKVEKGKKAHEGKLAKIQRGDGIVWEFIKVYQTTSEEEYEEAQEMTAPIVVHPRLPMKSTSPAPIFGQPSPLFSSIANLGPSLNDLRIVSKKWQVIDNPLAKLASSVGTKAAWA
ncbi:hypothetical protein E2P81_ATG03437 [Venturia nashicola]|uniref:Uncharacterized protein n=1 Tax=Venturia nashicola TaxID=86259 RepID=A0A4Z1P8M9_9PEZI|nr:hypothetical protein E6O75_ATG03510 [Venturia nashicola]TLD37762.1 hypothetical protein E2P81_ATG03437 [Venturia nashicola]